MRFGKHKAKIIEKQHSFFEVDLISSFQIPINDVSTYFKGESETCLEFKVKGFTKSIPWEEMG